MKIDDIAYTSTLAKINPQHKLAFAVIPLTICLFANSFITNAITIMVMTFASVHFTSIGIVKYLKLILIPLGFLLIGTITIIVSANPANSILIFGIPIGNTVYGVTYSSLFYGLNLILRAIASVSCMYFISLTTPITDISYAFRKLKIPELFISLMELIYRYIFVLLEEAAKIKTAQLSRLGYKNFKSSVQSTGELIATLFLRTLMRCERVNSALESRGYSGGELKTMKKQYLNSKHLMPCSLILAALLVISAITERSLVSWIS